LSELSCSRTAWIEIYDVIIESRRPHNDDVYGADEMYCTGTMGELAGIIKVDEHVIGDGNVGPMTKRLSEFYVQRTAIEGVQVAG
jgi:branched-subunit amino acid aminotransferase/4-amino-4-deoxychorismate lyase